MIWLSYLGIAAKALAAHRLRTLLTTLSITIGAFAIVLMSSLAEGGITTLNRGIEEIGGTRLIFVVPTVPERKQGMFTTGFEQRDARWLLEGVPHVAESTVFAALGMRDVTSNEGQQDRTHLVAGSSSFFEVFRMRVDHGRAFSEDEDQRHARVCVAGPKLAAKLWQGDALNRVVTIGGLRCRVIGVLAQNERFGIDFGFDWLDVLVAPLGAITDVEARTRDETTIVAKTVDARANAHVQRILNARLMERHHGVIDFKVHDFSSIISQLDTIFGLAQVLVAVIAGIALLIGGVGVMNMMLISVSERVSEIGIRKALGAAQRDISAQFLCEAVMLSGFGGLLGTLSGALAAALAAALVRSALPTWVGSVSVPAVMVAMAVSLGVGISFGWLPARQAGRLDPVTAMRP
ncbi:ABC transporter permease [Hyalangium versicolor]|uniref:ABC transporter permease n=1 Tax=Hyalangium versicolor TaxID=2861190 RepID=UPI001CCBE61F|nr:ABC transporter permease [Hyalangium versicolor]